ncbi:hypothetical protein [Olleya marilimosa]|uniref:Uncharacterized protein n=1 Tax=Olleya marilimosa TaxID=272164 RepID=A0ABR8LWX7_9FLAO|nr:hypothetical protein [Olleya marilimosa]MBD3864677.1 hypothetical protein [Olleya marilimosa]MBD3892190.1 hypothetical protein [Olleya marilimosa]
MKLTTIILNILLLSISLKEYHVFNDIKDCIKIKPKKTLYYKHTIDSIKPNSITHDLLINGNENFDIILTTIKKEDYEEAKQIKTTHLLDKTLIPSQVNLTESCYTVKTPIKTVKTCLEDDEELISLSYSGFIKTINSCVFYENWFESSTTNLLINLENGSTSYITGNELIFSPNLKFIYSYANDGIDFAGISLHQIIDKKAQPILITDYEIEEKYNFDFSSFGKVFWVSDSSFYASNGNEYFKFKIQDKLVNYRNEYKENIIHSENNKFTIKVDKLKNGTFRYTSWNKPNSTNDRPNLVLYNGEVEQQTKYGSRFDYRFENGEYLYIVEINTETTNAKRVILRLYKNHNEILYTKLTDLSK